MDAQDGEVLAGRQADPRRGPELSGDADLERARCVRYVRVGDDQPLLGVEHPARATGGRVARVAHLNGHRRGLGATHHALDGLRRAVAGGQDAGRDQDHDDDGGCERQPAEQSRAPRAADDQAVYRRLGLGPELAEDCRGREGAGRGWRRAPCRRPGSARRPSTSADSTLRPFRNVPLLEPRSSSETVPSASSSMTAWCRETLPSGTVRSQSFPRPIRMRPTSTVAVVPRASPDRIVSRIGSASRSVIAGRGLRTHCRRSPPRPGWPSGRARRARRRSRRPGSDG